MFKACLLTVATIATAVDAHILRDSWMMSKNIDPDFMHLQALKASSNAARVEARLAMSGRVSAENSKFDLNKQFAYAQRWAYGLVNGTSIATSSKICKSALISGIDSSIKLVDNRFVWMPDYQVKFQKAQDEVSGYFNTAYAYCKFDQFYSSIKLFFNPYSTDHLGRAVSRLLTSMTGKFWSHVNCIIDGYLGNNFYDVGHCTGKLIVIALDTTLG